MSLFDDLDVYVSQKGEPALRRMLNDSALVDQMFDILISDGTSILRWSGNRNPAVYRELEWLRSVDRKEAPRLLKQRLGLADIGSMRTGINEPGKIETSLFDTISAFAKFEGMLASANLDDNDLTKEDAIKELDSIETDLKNLRGNLTAQNALFRRNQDNEAAKEEIARLKTKIQNLEKDQVNWEAKVAELGGRPFRGNMSPQQRRQNLNLVRQTGKQDRQKEELQRLKRIRNVRICIWIFIVVCIGIAGYSLFMSETKFDSSRVTPEMLQTYIWNLFPNQESLSINSFRNVDNTMKYLRERGLKVSTVKFASATEVKIKTLNPDSEGSYDQAYYVSVEETFARSVSDVVKTFFVGFVTRSDALRLALLRTQDSMLIYLQPFFSGIMMKVAYDNSLLLPGYLEDDQGRLISRDDELWNRQWSRYVAAGSGSFVAAYYAMGYLVDFYGAAATIQSGMRGTLSYYLSTFMGYIASALSETGLATAVGLGLPLTMILIFFAFAYLAYSLSGPVRRGAESVDKTIQVVRKIRGASPARGKAELARSYLAQVGHDIEAAARLLAMDPGFS